MKKILISLLSVIFIISMFSTVYAATGSISSAASTDTVIKGKTFTVTLTGTADSPIDGMYTKISYDKNVLSLESANAGENYGNNSSEGEVLVTNNSSTTSPTNANLYTITFKVADDANVNTTDISFSESEIHLNAEGTVKSVATNIDNVTIKIVEDDTTAGEQEDDSSNDETDDGYDADDNTDDNTDSDNDTKEENKDKNVNKDKNTNKDKTKLPQTGAENTTIIAIIALGIISVISYVSYKKYNNI